MSPDTPPSTGPLAGLTVLEIVGLGPGPFCGMMLADLGADVIRVDRVDPSKMLRLTEQRFDVLARGRRSIALDLTCQDGLAVLLRLVDGADVMFEGMRPGVAERLGFGPDVCAERNPRLVYGRMTGWGQTGPLAKTVGHDINYLALSGMLHTVGRADRRPPPPLNLVADFGGGGLMLAFGILAAVFEAKQSGKGQVVDAAMLEGAAALGAMTHGLAAAGVWSTDRESNLLDGGTPFYDTYRTADQRFVAVGAIEPQFFSALIDGLGLGDDLKEAQWDQERWDDLRQAFVAAFGAQSRDYWASHFSGTDACVSPVLTYEEATAHPHSVGRSSFIDVDGVTQPAPVPRFSRSLVAVPHPPVDPGTYSLAILDEFGFASDEIAGLMDQGICR